MKTHKLLMGGGRKGKREKGKESEWCVILKGTVPIFIIAARMGRSVNITGNEKERAEGKR